MDARTWIDDLGLQPHPEGGWYLETYRSRDVVETARGPRPASTAIFYLLERGEFSALHRIASDELWHHHAGGALDVVELRADEVVVHRLGSDRRAGERPQVVIPAGVWFGARPAADAAYALVGCTVAPGFDFADFEMARAEELRRTHAHAASWIDALTRAAGGLGPGVRSDPA